MTSSEFITLDPEFEEVLREVAADPDSSLLRVPRPKRIRSLFDRGSAVGALEPGLTRAEQHLLQVHRNELAWLLRQACLVKLVEGPKSRLYVSRYITAERQVELMRPSTMRSQLDLERGTAAGAKDEAPAIALLDRCVADPLGEEPTVGALASASFRLERTDEARIMSAMELAQGSGPRSALRVLGDVLSMHPNRRNAASSWSQVGLAYARILEFRRAREAYSMLCTSDDPPLVAWLSRISMDIQLGDETDVRSVAGQLSDQTLVSHPVLLHFKESLTRLRLLGEWHSTAEAVSVAKTLRVRYHGVVGEIADVLG